MAIHGQISLNGHSLAVWHAKRISGGSNPDDINVYRWQVDSTDGRDVFHLSGTIEHRYGDNAVAFVAKIMTSAAELKS